MSGLKIDEVETQGPWVKPGITTLSYTIYKILEQVGITKNDDSDSISD